MARRRRLWCGPATEPAAVDVSDVAIPMRAAVEVALAEALAGGQSPVRARFDVARRFGLTVLRVEAIELQCGGRIGFRRKRTANIAASDIGKRAAPEC